MKDRIGLVACCGKKSAVPCAAKDLYQSLLFRRSRAYVEKHCCGWAVLSALHGLVLPDQVISPYDLAFGSLDVDEWRGWLERTHAQIRQQFPKGKFLVLAGADYRAALDGLDYLAPMARMGIGQQLVWLDRATRTQTPRRGMCG